jgi:hypothetical protein
MCGTSYHVCTALRGGQRRRPAGFGDGGTAQVTLGDARAPSQSCGAASFYLELRSRPITPSLCFLDFGAIRSFVGAEGPFSVFSLRRRWSARCLQ